MPFTDHFSSFDDTDWLGTGKIPASLTYGWVKFEVTSGDPIVAMNRVTFAKCTVGDTACTGTPGWLRIMTDAPLSTLPPPTLGVLNVVPDTATLSVAGPSYGRTGLRTTESGSNFYNALQITQKVRDAKTSNVSLVGSAFGATTGSPATLADLKTNVDTNNGFILLYAANDTTHASGPTAVTCDSGATANFCQGKYYVYFGGSWQTPLTVSGTPFRRPDLGIDVQPRTPPGGQQPVSAPTFSVTLYTAISNRSWSTYGYLMNANGEEKSIVQKSCPATVSDPNSPSYTTTCF